MPQTRRHMYPIESSPSQTPAHIIYHNSPQVTMTMRENLVRRADLCRATHRPTSGNSPGANGQTHPWGCGWGAEGPPVCKAERRTALTARAASGPREISNTCHKGIRRCLEPLPPHLHLSPVASRPAPPVCANATGARFSLSPALAPDILIWSLSRSSR